MNIDSENGYCTTYSKLSPWPQCRPRTKPEPPRSKDRESARCHDANVEAC
jgi:hypothetical protein